MSFDDFWNHYPRREGKSACLKKWAAKNLDGKSALIVEHVKRRAKDDKKWAAGYIPMPLTFLGQERWEDDYERIVPKQSPGKPVAELLPRPEDPQQDKYKTMLNLAMLKLLMSVRGVSVDNLRRAVRLRNEMAAEMRAMWGEEARNDELADLSAGYIGRLKAALLP